MKETFIISNSSGRESDLGRLALVGLDRWEFIEEEGSCAVSHGFSNTEGVVKVLPE